MKIDNCLRIRNKRVLCIKNISKNMCFVNSGIIYKEIFLKKP